MAIITVQPTRNDKRLVLWERHDDHPDGEIWIVGVEDRTYKVAETPGVLKALAAGDLEKVTRKRGGSAKADKPVDDTDDDQGDDEPGDGDAGEGEGA